MKFFTINIMISNHTIERLIIYNRFLKGLYNKGYSVITSKKIAQTFSKTSAQVRRDLSSLGKKGKPGVGYNIKNLVNDIDDVLGLKRTWGVILIGAGNLGRALFYYPGFKREGFEFRMVIDNDPQRTGKKWSNIRISDLKALKTKIRLKNISIAVITVPERSAQKVADELVKAGIKEILSFAPVTLNVPRNVNVRYTDMALELENLSYHLARRRQK